MSEAVNERFLTHDKAVHLDEATAFAELRLTRHLQGQEIEAVRDRREEAREDDWVVDRGGVYDPLNHRLDHHQFRSTDPDRPRRENGVAYAAAGMQWIEIGRECVCEVCRRLQVEASTELIEAVFQEIDTLVMQPIDAEDNGELAVKSRYVGGTEDVPIASLPLADMVRGLNVAVDERHSSDDVFFEVSDLMEHYLHGRIVKSVREQLCRDLLGAGERIEEGRIVFLHDPVPREIEGVIHEVESRVAFVVFQQEASTEWNIRAVPLAAGSFEFRRGLPEEWRGLLGTAANDRLSFADHTGFPAAIFCHAGGFVAKAGDAETAKALASIAVE